MRNIKIELKWAAIFVLMMLAWMLLERVGGFHDRRIEQHSIVTNLVAIPAIAVYVLALPDKRKNHYGGHMTYVQGLVTGLIITLFVTLVSPLTQYITSQIITPDYFKNKKTRSLCPGFALLLVKVPLFQCEYHQLITHKNEQRPGEQP